MRLTGLRNLAITTFHCKNIRVLHTTADSLLLETLTCCNFLVHWNHWNTRSSSSTIILMAYVRNLCECCIVASVWKDSMPNYKKRGGGEKRETFSGSELTYYIHYECSECKNVQFFISSACLVFLA